MNVTPQQAQQSLSDINRISHQTQGKLLYGVLGPILVVWGIVWSVCYTIVHFRVEWAGWTWLIGNALGALATIYLGWIRPRHGPVRSALADRLGRRLFWFWLLLFIFGDIWLALLWPWQGMQLSLFVVTLVMFAFITQGLWLEMPFLIGLGLLITALSMIGYVGSFFLAGLLNLWMAVTGGGVLLASGIYLLLRWR